MEGTGKKKERKRTVRSAIVFMFVCIWHSGLGGVDAVLSCENVCNLSLASCQSLE